MAVVTNKVVIATMTTEVIMVVDLMTVATTLMATVAMMEAIGIGMAADVLTVIGIMAVVA